MADSESDIEVVSQTRAQNKQNAKGPGSRERRSQESTQIVPSTGSDEGATAAALKGTSPEEHPPSTASVPAKKRRPKPKPKGRPQGSAPSQTQDLLDPDDDYSHFILPTNLEFSVKTQKEVKANRKAAHRQASASANHDSPDKGTSPQPHKKRSNVIEIRPEDSDSRSSAGSTSSPRRESPRKKPKKRKTDKLLQSRSLDNFPNSTDSEASASDQPLPRDNPGQPKQSPKRRQLTPTRQIDPLDLLMAQQQNKAQQSWRYSNHNRANDYTASFNPPEDLSFDNNVEDISMDHDPAVLKAIERRKAEEELRQRQRQGSSTSNQQQEDLGIPVQYTIQPVGCATPEDYQNLPSEAASALAGFEAPLQYTLFSKSSFKALFSYVARMKGMVNENDLVLVDEDEQIWPSAKPESRHHCGSVTLKAFHVSVWHQVEDDRYNQRLQSGTAASFSESHLDPQTSQVVGQQSPSVDPVPVPSATEPKLHLQLRSKQHGTTKAVMKKSSSVRKIIKWYFRKFSLPENLIDASSTKLIFDDEDLDKAILLKDTEIEDKDLLDIVW